MESLEELKSAISSLVLVDLNFKKVDFVNSSLLNIQCLALFLFLFNFSKVHE